MALDVKGLSQHQRLRWRRAVWGEDAISVLVSTKRVMVEI
jgi:hypothetical protein